MNTAKLKHPALLAGVVFALALLWATHDRTSQLHGHLQTITASVNGLIGLTAQAPEASERILELPEDGQVWSAVFVWPEHREADPDSRRLAALFAAEPRLQALLAQTKTYHYRPDDPLYAARFAPVMGTGTPQFWLMAPSAENPSQGTAVYAVGGSAVPRDAGQMVAAIDEAIQRICPRPRPKPVPPEPPQPPIAPTPPQIPPLQPIDPPDDEGLPLWVWILPIMAAAAGAVHEWKRNS